MRKRKENIILGEKLRRIRLWKGISQTDMLLLVVPDESEDHRARVSQWELGLRQPPIKAQIQYAQIADIPLENLLVDTRELPSHLLIRHPHFAGQNKKNKVAAFPRISENADRQPGRLAAVCSSIPQNISALPVPAKAKLHNDEELSGNGDFEPSDSRMAICPVVMPFHHLISAALMTPQTAFISPDDSLPPFKELNPSAARNQLFQQRLFAQGLPAREVALFDDAFEHSFFEFDDAGSPIWIDWEVLHHDALTGCAEFYLAEMFAVKRRVYEAEDKAAGELPESLEISGSELDSYLPNEIFTPLAVDKVQLFRRGLTADFTFTRHWHEAAHSNQNRQPVKGSPDNDNKEIKNSAVSDYFNRYLSEIASRVKTSRDRTVGTSNDRRIVHQIELADYWINWRRAARLAKFDFDFMRTLSDARAVRFYELTKLKRVPPGIQTAETDSRMSIPKKLKIEYEQFAALMPLPRLTGEQEIKRQINGIIKPLRAAGYITSFALNPDQQDGAPRRARLAFRFSD